MSVTLSFGMVSLLGPTADAMAIANWMRSFCEQGACGAFQEWVRMPSKENLPYQLVSVTRSRAGKATLKMGNDVISPEIERLWSTTCISLPASLLDEAVPASFYVPGSNSGRLIPLRVPNLAYRLEAVGNGYARMRYRELIEEDPENSIWPRLLQFFELAERHQWIISLI